MATNEQYTGELRHVFGTLFRFAQTTHWELSFKWVSRHVIAAYESDILGQKVNILPLIREFSRAQRVLAQMVNEDALSLVKSYCVMVLNMVKSARPPKRSKWKIRLQIPTPDLDTLTEEDEDQ